MLNTGLRKYQAIQKAAKSVAEGKPGAKLRLKAATKAYVTHAETTAKKEAAAKVSDAKKKAAAAAKVSGIGRTKKAKTTTAKRKTTTTKRKSTTTRRKATGRRR